MKDLADLMYKTMVSIVHDMLNGQEYQTNKHEYVEWLKKVREAAEVVEHNAAQKIQEVLNAN